MGESEIGERDNATNSQVKISTTVVRIAVARVEFIPPNPAFAKTAVPPAKTAESIDHMNQLLNSAPILRPVEIGLEGSQSGPLPEA